jgi:tetratricopeptide (TPR) repeat protein
MAYAANDLWAEARVAFQNTARLDPKEPHAFLYVAVATLELGRREEGLRLLRELTARFPKLAAGHYRLGEVLLRAGQLDEALPAFERVTSLAPRQWHGWAGLGEIKLRQGKHAEAARFLEKAIQLEPRAKPAHHLLGQAYQKLGRTDDAQRELRLGLNATHHPMPDDWSVTAPQHMRLIQDQTQMAIEYIQARQPGRAITILERALPYHPTNLVLLQNLALAYQEAGQAPRARALLENAIKLDNRFAPLYVGLSVSCLSTGLTNEALAYANRAIELEPRQAQSHMAKANVLLFLEQDEGALAELELAFGYAPQNPQLQMEMGEICFRNLDRPLDAQTHYQKAVEADPTFLPAWVRLVELNLVQTNLAQAQEVLAQLRKLAPAEPIVGSLSNRLQELRALSQGTNATTNPPPR